MQCNFYHVGGALGIQQSYKRILRNQPTIAGISISFRILEDIIYKVIILSSKVIQKRMADHPQMTLDKLVRTRIFSSRYWKEECFGLNAQQLIDKAIKLEYIGSTYSGSRRPTKFICLAFKMLQMNLPKEIAIQFLQTKDYKYLTTLGVFYLRLITKPPQVYQLLQPFYNDNRKLRVRDTIGTFSIIHMDQFIDKLLHQDIALDVILPRIQKRNILEDQGILQPRVSILQQQLQDQPEPSLNSKQINQIKQKSKSDQDSDSDDRDK